MREFGKWDEMYKCPRVNGLSREGIEDNKLERKRKMGDGRVWLTERVGG